MDVVAPALANFMSRCRYRTVVFASTDVVSCRATKSFEVYYAR